MSLIPSPEFVLVKPAKQKKKTESGIHLPNKKRAHSEGRVVAVGGEKDRPYTTDDIIIFKMFSPIRHKEGDKEYLFIKHEDVLGIIK